MTLLQLVLCITTLETASVIRKQHSFYCLQEKWHSSLLHNDFLSFNTVKCLHKHLFWFFFSNKSAPKYIVLKKGQFIFSFIFLSFQVLSNIFLRTTAFNTLKRSNFFLKNKKIQKKIEFHPKTSGANTLFSTGWASHLWGEIGALRQISCGRHWSDFYSV